MYKKQRKELGKRLRAARLKKKLSIEELSRIPEVGVSTLLIGRIERGTTASFWAIRNLARFLKVRGAPTNDFMPLPKRSKRG